MALGLNPFIKSLMTSMFIFFLAFMFIGSFLAVTNPSSEILSSKYGINKSISNFNNSLSGFSVTSEEIYGTLSNSKPSLTAYVFLIFKGAFDIPFVFVSFLFDSLKTLSLVLFPMFQGTGLGSILTIGLGLIVASLVTTMVLLVVKAIRTGESER